MSGGKKLLDFIKDYRKEDNSIERKYSSIPALYYRRMLSAWAQDVPFKEERPSKSVTELCQRTDQEYKIQERVSAAKEQAKVGIGKAQDYADGLPDKDQIVRNINRNMEKAKHTIRAQRPIDYEQEMDVFADVENVVKIESKIEQ